MVLRASRVRAPGDSGGTDKPCPVDNVLVRKRHRTCLQVNIVSGGPMKKNKAMEGLAGEEEKGLQMEVFE